MKAALLALAGAVVLALGGCGSAAASLPPTAGERAPTTSVLPDTSPPTSSQPSAASASPSGAAVSGDAARVAPAAPALPPIPASFRLGPLVYIRQTLNNCGPASIAEVLHFWGVEQTQAQAQTALRPDNNNRGMWPFPVPGYVRSLGMASLMGVGGNPTVVKALVANGFPVIVAQWVSASDHEAHYREIEGFDDKRQVFVSTDSYLGPDHEISYSEFDQIWARGNQRFMVIYPPAKQALLDSVVGGAGWNKEAAYEADLIKQQNRQTDPRQTDPAVPSAFRRGERFLGPAWDHIQLGDLDAARSEIQQAAKAGASPVMIGWLNQALDSAKG